jgi:glycerate kinase
VADGGEGTALVLRESLGGRSVAATASDPLGRRLELPSGFVLLEVDEHPGRATRIRGEEVSGGDDAAAGGPVAVVETATASGLSLLAPGELDATAASTYGTGELIIAAVGSGARTVLVAVGGTATSDGGRGAIEAIEDGGGLAGARLTVLADVETRFENAAIEFGPQKGAGPAEVEQLTARLRQFAGRLPRSPLGLPRTGAGGGIAGGLWARYGAEIVSGSKYVLDSIGFDARLGQSGCVIVGEGRLDRQSLGGKIVGEILRRAESAEVPCHAIVGGVDLEPESQAAFASIQVASALEEIQAAAAFVADRLASSG